VLPAHTATFRRREGGWWGGSPSDGFGFRSFIHIQAAAVVQHGSFVEDAREREEEDEWIGRENSKYCVRLEWGGVPRMQRC
jgi:hypothetical protein